MYLKLVSILSYDLAFSQVDSCYCVKMESFMEQFKAATTPGPAQITRGAVIVASDKSGTLINLLS